MHAGSKLLLFEQHNACTPCRAAVLQSCVWGAASAAPVPHTLPSAFSARHRCCRCSLLEPSEEARPSFLADVPDEVAGQLRLAAAASLLRLARRHDSRLGAGCYCMLALVMQDNQTSVRGVFAAKLYKLVSYFNVSVL